MVMIYINQQTDICAGKQFRISWKIFTLEAN